MRRQPPRTGGTGAVARGRELGDGALRLHDRTSPGEGRRGSMDARTARNRRCAAEHRRWPAMAPTGLQGAAGCHPPREPRSGHQGRGSALPAGRQARRQVAGEVRVGGGGQRSERWEEKEAGHRAGAGRRRRVREATTVAEEATKGRRKVGGAGEHPRVARERSGVVL